MQPQDDRRPQRWTVDLALGRRWWLLPVASVVPVPLHITAEKLILLDSSNIAVQGVFERGSVVVGILYFSVPYVAAVLACRTNKWTHKVVAAAVVCGGTLAVGAEGYWIFGVGMNPSVEVGSYIFAQLLLHVGLLHLLGWPRWRDAYPPAVKRSASLLFLLGYMAAAAIAAHLLIRIKFTAGDISVTAFIFAVGFVGQLAGTASSKRAAMALAVFALPLLAGVFWLQPHRFGVSLNPWVEPLTCWAVSLIAWSICYFHRCDRVRPVAADARPPLA